MLIIPVQVLLPHTAVQSVSFDDAQISFDVRNGSWVQSLVLR